MYRLKSLKDLWDQCSALIKWSTDCDHNRTCRRNRGRPIPDRHMIICARSADGKQDGSNEVLHRFPFLAGPQTRWPNAAICVGRMKLIHVGRNDALHPIRLSLLLQTKQPHDGRTKFVRLFVPTVVRPLIRSDLLRLSLGDSRAHASTDKTRRGQDCGVYPQSSTLDHPRRHVQRPLSRRSRPRSDTLTDRRGTDGDVSSWKHTPIRMIFHIHLRTHQGG